MTVPPERDDASHEFDIESEPSDARSQSHEASLSATDVDTITRFDTEDGGELADEPASRQPIVREPETEIGDFEELTLAEALGQFLHAPRTTWRSIRQVAQITVEDSGSSASLSVPVPDALTAPSSRLSPVRFSIAWLDDAERREQILLVGMRLLAFVFALIGSVILVNSPVRIEEQTFPQGAPFLVLGVLWWLAATLYLPLVEWWSAMSAEERRWSLIRAAVIAILLVGFIVAYNLFFSAPNYPSVWLVLGVGTLVVGVGYRLNHRRVKRKRRKLLPEANGEDNELEAVAFAGDALSTADDSVELSASYSASGFFGISFAKLVLIPLGLVLSIIAWFAATGNQFTFIGFWSWMISIGVWFYVLLPDSWNPLDTISSLWVKVQTFRPRLNWTVIALIGILLIGAYFRLHNLHTVPPEMTSDHVEKLLDSQRVLDGTHQIFFPNNGGREPMQMYLMAFFSQLPGLGMNFDTLKLLAVIESLITLPALWWMGREVIGRNTEHNRRLGNTVGLIMAALVAVSYWHVVMTRLSLRIILMPLFTALLIVYLARSLRSNNQGDFVKAGLLLGISFYTYQASRMLPVVVVAGVVLAILLRGRTFETNKRYVANLIVLALMALVVFVPLFSFSLDSTVDGPLHFWMRTSGRLLGDDLITTTDDTGRIITRNATFEERVQAFSENVPVLMSNIRNALLMYNWKGDVAWINGVPNQPAMDAYTGALFILGLVAWGARMVKRRDPVDWLMPVMLFIMLMPSALSIAYPLENPSATRTSGTLPEAYLFTALPLAILVLDIAKLSIRRWGYAIVGGLLVLVVGGSYIANSYTVFERYPRTYYSPSLPYSTAGEVMRGFAAFGGTYGNAFMVAYPYWWDHRAVGLEAGLVDWPNGILSIQDVPTFLYEAWLRQGVYRFDPDRDILFFYSAQDEDAERLLQEWFPDGRVQRIVPDVPAQAEDAFMIYTVPAMGVDAFLTFLSEQGVVA